jgi:hypothetical protein
MFATQSLLYALGIGASKTLAASAAVNWMLKEGLGKVARMGVSTSFAQNLDSDIKARHTTSLPDNSTALHLTCNTHLSCCKRCAIGL